MKLYNMKGASYLLMPKRLGFLVKQIAKPIKWELSRESVDNNYIWEYIYYVSDDGIVEDHWNLTIYWDKKRAEEEKAKNTAIYLKKLLDDKWMNYKEIVWLREWNEKLVEENNKLKEENGELKNLPPVNVETLKPRGNWYRPDTMPKWDIETMIEQNKKWYKLDTQF